MFDDTHRLTAPRAARARDDTHTSHDTHIHTHDTVTHTHRL